MNDIEYLATLDSILASFAKPKDRIWLLNHLIRHKKRLEKALEHGREYFKKNKQKLYEYHREYRKRNPEKYRTQSLLYYHRNKSARLSRTSKRI